MSKNNMLEIEVEKHVVEALQQLLLAMKLPKSEMIIRFKIESSYSTQGMRHDEISIISSSTVRRDDDD